jgi:hypothetical protein
VYRRFRARLGAGALGRAEALRYNALAAECAGVLVDNRAVGFVVGIEGNARRRAAQPPRQNLFSRRKRPPAQILAVKFEEFNEGTSRFRQ